MCYYTHSVSEQSSSNIIILFEYVCLSVYSFTCNSGMIARLCPNFQSSFRDDFGHKKLGAAEWDLVFMSFQGPSRLSTKHTSNACSLAIRWSMWLLQCDNCSTGMQPTASRPKGLSGSGLEGGWVMGKWLKTTGYVIFIKGEYSASITMMHITLHKIKHKHVEILAALSYYIFYGC